MASRRWRAGRLVRICQVCLCDLYADEPGAFCVDCGAIRARLADRAGDGWVWRLPPALRRERAARVAAHAARVAREM